jgi:hypothetical protein
MHINTESDHHHRETIKTQNNDENIWKINQKLA